MARSHKYPFPIAQSKPQSMVTESYRTLRTNIQFANALHDSSVMLVTSALAGEGKTSTAVNLAIVSAQAGKRVVVIDADLRNPQVHVHLRVPNEAGLSNLLIKETCLEKVLSATDMAGLYVLSGGPVPTNPSEILSSMEFQDVVLQCRNQFDLVIIDSPPLLAVSDPAVVIRVVDGIILVISAKKTHRSSAQQAISIIQQVNGRILGGVLNRVTKGTKTYSYHQSTGLPPKVVQPLPDRKSVDLAKQSMQ